VIGYLRSDGHFAVVKLADDADVEAHAKQLEVLAEAMRRDSTVDR
jgi:hypothetical protein